MRATPRENHDDQPSDESSQRMFSPRGVIERAAGASKSFVRDRIGPSIARRQPTRDEPDLGRWGLTVDAVDVLTSDDVRLDQLVESHGSPLHVVSRSALERNIDEAAQPARDGTGAEVFYSYKTNPVPGVLQRIHAGGIGAEVISEYEFWLARRLGVPGDRIIYNGPAKSSDSLREAIRCETMLINANSTGDLERIAVIASELGVAANVGVRVALADMWGGQFGLRWDSEETNAAIRRAIEHPMLNMQAFHFHRGMTMRTEADVESHVRGILTFCDDARSATGWHPEILDIGGSLACPTVAGVSRRQFRLNRALATDVVPIDPDITISVGDAARLSLTLIREHFEAAGLATPRVVIEPGRALTGNTQFLLTTVLDVKDDTDPVHAVVDAGINIAESVANEFHQLFTVERPLAAAGRSYRIAGPICTPADVLYNNWRLPELRVGEALAIMDTGAYCVPFSTTFSFPRPAIVSVDNGRVTVLRERETFDDIVGRDRTPPLDGPADRP